MYAHPHETKTKGLPEVDLIAPGSPEHDRMANLHGGKENDRLYDVLLYSAVLHNRSQKNISAYVIRTEFTRGDGSTYHQDNAFQMDKIKPDEKRLISQLWSLPDRRLPQGGQELPPPVGFLAAQQDVVKVTLILDGVMFEDGTVIGEDGSGTVNVINGMRSLFADLVASRSFKAVEAAANDETDNRAAQWRRMWADELLRLKQLYGEQRAIDYAAERLKDPYPNRQAEK